MIIYQFSATMSAYTHDTIYIKYQHIYIKAVDWARTSPAYNYDIKKAYLFDYLKELSEGERDVMIEPHVWFVRLSNVRFTNAENNKNIFFKIHWGYRFKVYRIPKEVIEDDKPKYVWEFVEEGSIGTVVLTRIHETRRDVTISMFGNHNSGNLFEVSYDLYLLTDIY